MRMALAQAVHHCRYRNVFGKRLYDQPMMRAVLADMALEVEARGRFGVSAVRARSTAPPTIRGEAAYARVMTPAAKYWICKLAPGFVFEAMECLGGNGYVEESILPRLYREAPVNAIWEGSGNVMCLDVLRALKREEEAAVVATWRATPARRPGSRRRICDQSMRRGARETVGRLALAASVAALKVSAPAAVAEIFMRTRLDNPHGALYGAGRMDDAAMEMLLQRALPEH